MDCTSKAHSDGTPSINLESGLDNDNERQHGRLQTGDLDQSSTSSYSIFTTVQKRWIVLLVAFAAMFSPLSSFIYYPALSSLATDLKVSLELMNLTITSYMIVSGITPAMIGNMADMVGRRPVYVLTFLVYFAANIGLALQRSYPALFVLRMLQSVGSSGTISIAYGVIADIASPGERGSYNGIMLCGPNTAPSLGPVLGGVLAERAGWRWIFWFLTILSGFALIAMVLFLPETARNIVGNGGVSAKGINKSLLSSIKGWHLTTATDGKGLRKRKLRIPNPMTCLYVIFYKDTASIILVNAIFYMTYCCVQASLSTLFIRLYNFKELQAGLIYLPFGFGCAVASYTTVAKAHGLTVDKLKGDDLSKMPLEEARLRSIWYPIAIAIIALAGYGWALHAKAICGTLLSDLHPLCPATAQASLNIVRCSLAAGGLAALESIIDHLGVGWCFTLFAAICATAIPILLAERQWGMNWRLARDSKASPQKKNEADQMSRCKGVKAERPSTWTEVGAKIEGMQEMKEGAG
ncbi:MAG: hypothetical protein M1830_010695 [Pleopsidium flavum]|nr:MAG: hypothetical protein M1830_010695 [Pleopsidium flavum]